MLRGELGIKSGDEYRGTHHFGEPGRVVYQRIPGWSDVRSVQLQRLRARNHRRRAWSGVRRRQPRLGGDSREWLCLGSSDYECQ